MIQRPVVSYFSFSPAHLDSQNFLLSWQQNIGLRGAEPRCTRHMVPCYVLTIVSVSRLLDVPEFRDDGHGLVVELAPEVEVVHLLGQVELVDALRPERE